MGKAPRIAVPVALSALALMAVHGSAQETGASALPGPAGPENPDMVQDWRNATSRILAPPSPADQATDAVIAQWRGLQQADNLGFSAYANFMLANPGWPGEDRMRRLAETSPGAANVDPRQLVAYFTRYPPTTATGQARYAVALGALGRVDEARIAARAAWRRGAIAQEDEQRILSAFAGALSPEDHLAHADAVLWSGDTYAAERMLGWLSPTRRPIVEARIAMQRRSADAALKVAAADPIGMADGGYLADKAKWLTNSGDWIGGRTALANRLPLMTPVAQPERWFETLLAAARAAGQDGNWTMAWQIASRLDDAFAPGTDVSAQPIGVRDDYTSLAWLAGTTALNKLARPGDAIGLFTRYAGGARSPQTISKGLYWAGRAAIAAGNPAQAQDYFRRAAAYPDQYYGQLALERIGQPVPLPANAAARPVVVTQIDRDAFQNRSVVRAARRLGATGNWQDQSKLLRAIANNAATDQDGLLIAELATSLSRPDLGVMAGRRALSSGLSAYTASSFPQVSVPDGHKFNWTMIHAIARQESQFDRAIVSHAGARGLMQLMPGTARQTAGRIGLGYSEGALSDPQFNIQLGSTYFRQMLDYYSGSYPLAVAAYNAGPGNVNKWLRANGDPRLGGDWVQWIEDIPITETRNYVQRVLENAVVYDLLNPGNAGLRTATPLSHYLGKNQPG